MLMLRNVRISFPHLFKPHAFDNSQDGKYQATFLIEKGSDNEKAIKAYMAQVAKDKFGEKAQDVIKAQQATNRALLKDGDDKELDGYAGHWYLKAANKFAPAVIDRAKEKLEEKDGLPYAGSYVNVQLDIWGQNNKFGNYLNCTLAAVQFWKDGDSFGGGSRANIDAFDSADDATPSDDDDEQW